ncbi:hypothetical protein [Aggregatibacter kilianii]|uniref:hypothetical protein n=1 Tax=Aggregatibacter kilianii TaxID=2025884 RepID=UPI000D649796|nr:hypothetical protein [Aggregatibacter kilianii]
MKSPWSVNIAGGIYTVVALLSIFVFVAHTIYTPPGEFFSTISESIPFLPPLLSAIVYIILVMLPGIASVGIFAGKKWARILFILIAIFDISITLLGEFEMKAIVVKLLYNGIIAILLFTPSSSNYFNSTK